MDIWLNTQPPPSTIPPYSCILGAALTLTLSSVLVLRATVAKQRKVSRASTGSAKANTALNLPRTVFIVGSQHHKGEVPSVVEEKVHSSNGWRGEEGRPASSRARWGVWCAWCAGAQLCSWSASCCGATTSVCSLSWRSRDQVGPRTPPAACDASDMLFFVPRAARQTHCCKRCVRHLVGDGC